MQIFSFSLNAAAGERFARIIPQVGRIPRYAIGDSANFFCALSLRSAGDMSFDKDSPNPRRARLFAELGLESASVVAAKQVHSKDVFAIESGYDPGVGSLSGDGLTAVDPSFVLSVTVADCLPIFLVDAETGAFSLLHSGWKGTGIVLRALAVMSERWGTAPDSVSAVLGPCIRGCCYEVDAERAKLFDQEFGAVCTGKPLGSSVKRIGERFFIDLQAANAALLESSGVRTISVCRDCTFTDDRFGSLRREGPDRFTRMVAILGRLP